MRKTRSLNPQFARRVPAVIDGLLAAMLAIRQPLNDAAGHIRELTEYLDFEIGKTQLAMTADGAPLPHLQKWLDHLKMIRAIVTPDEMLQPGLAMRELVDQLQESFTDDADADDLSDADLSAIDDDVAA